MDCGLDFPTCQNIIVVFHLWLRIPTVSSLCFLCNAFPIICAGLYPSSSILLSRCSSILLPFRNVFLFISFSTILILWTMPDSELQDFLSLQMFNVTCLKLFLLIFHFFFFSIIQDNTITMVHILHCQDSARKHDCPYTFSTHYHWPVLPCFPIQFFKLKITFFCHKSYHIQTQPVHLELSKVLQFFFHR